MARVGGTPGQCPFLSQVCGEPGHPTVQPCPTAPPSMSPPPGPSLHWLQVLPEPQVRSSQILEGKNRVSGPPCTLGLRAVVFILPPR